MDGWNSENINYLIIKYYYDHIHIFGQGTLWSFNDQQKQMWSCMILTQLNMEYYKTVKLIINFLKVKCTCI